VVQSSARALLLRKDRPSSGDSPGDHAARNTTPVDGWFVTRTGQHEEMCTVRAQTGRPPRDARRPSRADPATPSTNCACFRGLRSASRGLLFRGKHVTPTELADVTAGAAFNARKSAQARRLGWQQLKAIRQEAIRSTAVALQARTSGRSCPLPFNAGNHKPTCAVTMKEQLATHATHPWTVCIPGTRARIGPLPEKLRAESRCIPAWAVRGRGQAEAANRPGEPPAVKSATARTIDQRATSLQKVLRRAARLNQLARVSAQRATRETQYESFGEKVIGVSMPIGALPFPRTFRARGVGDRVTYRV
jgi:hypothetical protein